MPAIPRPSLASCAISASPCASRTRRKNLRDLERARPILFSHDLTRTGGPMALFRTLRESLSSAPPWDVSVMGMGPGPMEETFRQLDAPFHRVDESPPPWIYEDVLAHISATNPDVVVLNGSPLYQVVILLAWKGIPVIWWYHDGLDVAARDGHMFRVPSLEGMTRYALELADCVIAPAEDTLEQLQIFCPNARGRRTHIPNGLDIGELSRRGLSLEAERGRVREALGFPSGAIVFLCVGSFEARKNQLRLVRAFQQLVDEVDPRIAPRLMLVFVGSLYPEGDGPDSYGEQVQRASAAKHQGQIRFLGVQDDVPRHMVGSDCHVLVSTNECSPLVNIEAMALGTVTISSRVHGIPEVVIDGVTGKLVDPVRVEDIKETLAWYVHAHDHDPAQLARMRSSARRFVETRHDIARTADLLADEITRMLASKSARPRLIGSEADQFLSRQLTQRWSVLKGDMAGETYLVRSYAHKLQPS